MTNQIISDSDLTHDLIFEWFENIPNDVKWIIGDESDFEENEFNTVEIIHFTTFVPIY